MAQRFREKSSVFCVENGKAAEKKRKKNVRRKMRFSLCIAMYTRVYYEHVYVYACVYVGIPICQWKSIFKTLDVATTNSCFQDFKKCHSF